MELIGQYPALQLGLAFILAAGISAFSIPVAVKISRTRGIIADITHRSSHQGKVALLGGLAVSGAILLPVFLFMDTSNIVSLQYRLAGILIILMVGFTDDMIRLTSLRKFTGQLVAAMVLTILGDIRIHHLHGFMGIGEITYIWSVLLSIFVILLITNAFNLIDGIDGLATLIGITSMATYGIWFYRNGFYDPCLVTVATCGALLAFYPYNVFSKRNKVFLGDTGAQLLGFLVAMGTIRFQELSLLDPGSNVYHTAPVISMGILVIPLFDTLRCFFLRIMRKTSPFSSDNNHLHHLLLRLRMNHATVSLLLAAYSLLASLTIMYIIDYIQNILTLTMILFLMVLIPTGWLKWRHDKVMLLKQRPTGMKPNSKITL